MRDRDDTTFDDATLERCHYLLDKIGAPTEDDAGMPLSVRFRLVALAYEKAHTP